MVVRNKTRGGESMKKIMAFLVKHSSVLAAAALFIGISSSHSACYVMFHQPKVPKALDAYRK